MTTFQKLCIKFVERAEYLGLKGKTRETECLAFFCGASTTLSMLEHEDAEHVLQCTFILVAVRGYFEVARVAQEAKAEEAKAA